jgi:uncharacterized protein (DUF1778 family)
MKKLQPELRPVERVEFRVRRRERDQLQEAADRLEVPVREFVREAALLRAKHVLKQGAGV